jgi:hypothetical protein
MEVDRFDRDQKDSCEAGPTAGTFDVDLVGGQTIPACGV